MRYLYSLNDIGGVASSFHGFSRGGDRSHLSVSEGGMSEGEVSPAAKPDEMTSDETPE